MRSPDLLISLLKEMVEQSDGRLSILVHLNMSKEERQRKHHVELLSDAGLVEWLNVNEHPRITNMGYDFIEAIDKKEGAKEKFLQALDTGAPLLNAVNAIAELFT